MFADVDFLRTQIHKYKLDRLEENIIKLAEPSIHIHRELVSEDKLSIGQSKLGGRPDLPPDYTWPHRGDKPLTFMGQFRFSDFATYDQTGLLPQLGILSYFYDVDSTPWGFQNERDGWHILFMEDENQELQRIDHPIYQGEWIEIKPLPAHQLSFSSQLSLPRVFFNDRMEYDLDFIKVNTDWSNNDFSEHRAYIKMCDDNYPSPRHHFLGQPVCWQDKVERETVIYSENIQTSQHPETGLYRYLPEQLEHIATEMDKWLFLFQIDEDGSMKTVLEAGGTIYICIPKASLATRRFEDCWTILQCT
ncbi:MAG: DUF1963 domain-containing protein [Aggregatilineales bacterium]